MGVFINMKKMFTFLVVFVLTITGCFSIVSAEKESINYDKESTEDEETTGLLPDDTIIMFAIVSGTYGSIQKTGLNSYEGTGPDIGMHTKLRFFAPRPYFNFLVTSFDGEMGQAVFREFSIPFFIGNVDYEQKTMNGIGLLCILKDRQVS